MGTIKEQIARCSLLGVQNAREVIIYLFETGGATSEAVTVKPCTNCPYAKEKAKHLLVKEDPNNPLEVVACNS